VAPFDPGVVVLLFRDVFCDVAMTRAFPVGLAHIAMHLSQELCVGHRREQMQAKKKAAELPPPLLFLILLFLI